MLNRKARSKRLNTLLTGVQRCQPAEKERKRYLLGFQRQVKLLDLFGALGDPETSARKPRSESS